MNLQGRSADHSTQIRLDDMAWDYMLELKRISKESMGLECSNAIIIRRALCVYFANLKQRLKRAKKAGTVNKVLAQERDLILWSAGKPRFKFQEPTEEQIMEIINDLLN